MRLGSRGSREFNFQKEAQERFCKGEELSSLLEGSYMLSSHFGYEIEHNGVFCSVFFSLKKIFMYLFLERGEGREKGREISMCGYLLRTPNWASGL